MSCRPSPPEDHRRDLIGAWHQPRVRCVRRESASSNPIEGTVLHDRDRDGHAQAHAYLRRGRRAHRRRARRADRARAQGRVRQAAAVGADARLRAGVGDRGLPARVRRARAVPDRPRRADRARRAEAHGRRRGAPRASAASPTRSTRSASPAPRSRKGSRSSPARTWTARRSTSACWSTIARTWSQLAASDQQRLRWHLHDLWPELEIPAGALDTAKWLGKASRRLARAEQTTRVRIARELVRQITASTTRIRELEAELAALVESYAPQLLAERGCGPLTAAKLDRRDRRRRPLRAPTPSSPAPAAAPRSPPPRATPTATASTAAATASSTAPFTASPSTKPTGIPTPPPTSRANKPKANHATKHSAASNATSPAASGGCCDHPPRQNPTRSRPRFPRGPRPATQSPSKRRPTRWPA